MFGGLLATIDLRNDPVQTFEALARFDPPRIDFLLPHGTWMQPPPGRVPGAAATPYADWLIAVFDHWYARPRGHVRLFEEIMQLLIGGASTYESVGLAPVQVVVIETDGSIAQEDTMRAAFDGAPENVRYVTHLPAENCATTRGRGLQPCNPRWFPQCDRVAPGRHAGCVCPGHER